MKHCKSWRCPVIMPPSMPLTTCLRLFQCVQDKLTPDIEARNQGLTLPPRRHGRTVRCNRKQKDGLEAILPRWPPTSSSGRVVHCQVPVLGTHVLSQAPERELEVTSSSQDLSPSGSWYTSHQCTTSQVDVHSIGGSHLPRFLVNFLSWPRCTIVQWLA